MKKKIAIIGSGIAGVSQIKPFTYLKEKNLSSRMKDVELPITLIEKKNILLKNIKNNEESLSKKIDNKNKILEKELGELEKQEKTIKSENLKFKKSISLQLNKSLVQLNKKNTGSLEYKIKQKEIESLNLSLIRNENDTTQKIRKILNDKLILNQEFKNYIDKEKGELMKVNDEILHVI